MSSILVTGGTGRLGGKVVSHLLEAGHEVRVSSRRALPPDRSLPYEWARVDYRDGTGVAEAVAGVDVVVHCASSQSVPVDRRVVDAARAAGRPHLVYISIVGVDRVPLKYYRSKLAAERMITESGLPHTILRTTQFHDLIRVALAVPVRSPLMFTPDLRFQPLDADAVASRMAELAGGEPAGRVPDMGGPEVRTMPELARSYLRATRRRRPVVPFRLPGAVFRGYAAGGHLAPGNATPGQTFDEYLAAQPDLERLSYLPRSSRLPRR